MAGLAGRTERGGQGAGLLKDLPPPYAGGQFARGESLGFNVENVAANRYWLTTGTFVTVASPRTFVVSASYTF